MLMICACEAFEPQFHRDDIALQRAAERMSIMLLAKMLVPAIDDSKEDFNRLNEEERKEAANRAADLRWAIDMSRKYAASMRSTAVQKLQTVLGPRVPSIPGFVEEETAADRVRATPASTVAPPIVPNTRSG